MNIIGTAVCEIVCTAFFGRFFKIKRMASSAKANKKMSIKHITFKSVDYATSITFGKNQNNRNFNHGQLQNIKKQWLQSTEVIPPITVNVVTNNIIDGQHRWRAFNELVEKGDLPDTSKIDVKYVSIPVELERDAIINANTNSKNWSLDDYISSYVKAGNKAYMMLDEWCKRHELTEANGKPKFRYGAAIITGKNCSNALKMVISHSGSMTLPKQTSYTLKCLKL